MGTSYEDAPRCKAAHPEDRSPCDGPVDAVRVVDQVGDELVGCVHHAAVVLASVENARVYPGSVEGAAIEAYNRAQLREPFAFNPDAPWPVGKAAGSPSAVDRRDDPAEDVPGADTTSSEPADVVYHGYRSPRGGSVVTVESLAGEVLGLLTHVSRHSPDGFNWGYGGSGPADLARSLLLAAVGSAATCSACAGTSRVVYTEAGERPYEPERDHELAPDEAVASCVACDDGHVQVPYQTFKWEHVAGWGDEWRISRGEVLEWLRRQETASDAGTGTPRVIGRAAADEERSPEQTTSGDEAGKAHPGLTTAEQQTPLEETEMSDLPAGHGRVVHTGPESQLSVMQEGPESVCLTAHDGMQKVRVPLTPAMVDELCQALCEATPLEELPPLPEVQVMTRSADRSATGGPAAELGRLRVGEEEHRELGEAAGPVGRSALVERATALRDQLVDALQRLTTSGRGVAGYDADEGPGPDAPGWGRRTFRSAAAEAAGW